MKATAETEQARTELTAELLILPDGRIFVHNLTQPFAELLSSLNPDCQQIAARLTTFADSNISHEFLD